MDITATTTKSVVGATTNEIDQATITTETKVVTAVVNSGNTIINGDGSLASVVAAEDINQWDLVTGNGRRATSDTIGYRNKIIGIAKANINIGFSGLVQTGGVITNSDWSWLPGDKLFLNGFNLSTVPPTTGFVVQVAIAITADTINIEIQPSILL